MKFAANDPLARAIRGENPKPNTPPKIPSFSTGKNLRYQYKAVRQELEDWIRKENIEKGRSMNEIALSDFGIASQAFVRACRSMGIEMRLMETRRNFSPELKTKTKRIVIEQSVLGISKRQISKNANCSKGVVEHYQTKYKNEISRLKVKCRKLVSDEMNLDNC